MSRKSQQIRAQRREKHARRWAGHEKAHRGALHDGLANELENFKLSKMEIEYENKSYFVQFSVLTAMLDMKVSEAAVLYRDWLISTLCRSIWWPTMTGEPSKQTAGASFDSG